MTESLLGGAAAAPLSIRATAVVASAVVRAARQLLTDLERGRRIDAACSARRDGGCLRRLRCDRRLELEDGL